MSRVLPSPLLSAGLFALWILLVQSLSAGQLVLGVALALFWPAVTAALRPAPVHVHKPLVIIRLFGHVVMDMLRANLAVGSAILARRRVRSAFVRVPLDLQDPNGLAVLAMIVTFTPGTAWVQRSPDGGTLLLHVFEDTGQAALVELVKRRYERPLMEIFQ